VEDKVYDQKRLKANVLLHRKRKLTFYKQVYLDSLPKIAYNFRCAVE